MRKMPPTSSSTMFDQAAMLAYGVPNRFRNSICCSTPWPGRLPADPAVDHHGAAETHAGQQQGDIADHVQETKSCLTPGSVLVIR